VSDLTWPWPRLTTSIRGSTPWSPQSPSRTTACTPNRCCSMLNRALPGSSAECWFRALSSGYSQPPFLPRSLTASGGDAAVAADIDNGLGVARHPPTRAVSLVRQQRVDTSLGRRVVEKKLAGSVLFLHRIHLANLEGTMRVARRDAEVKRQRIAKPDQARKQANCQDEPRECT